MIRELVRLQACRRLGRIQSFFNRRLATEARPRAFRAVARSTAYENARGGPPVPEWIENRESGAMHGG
jgi:hypothetical protein